MLVQAAFDGEAWSAAPAMHSARFGLGVAALGSTIYAVGGTDDSGAALASVEAFDGVVWTNAPSMGTARARSGQVSGSGVCLRCVSEVYQRRVFKVKRLRLRGSAERFSCDFRLRGSAVRFS